MLNNKIHYILFVISQYGWKNFNCKESIKILELICVFNKVVGYKISIQKPTVIL